MKSDMKKSDNSSSSKKVISIRRYLPLAVRVRYDAVRNSAPVKMAGMGVIVLVGIFGILLATQTVSPQSSASPDDAVTVISGLNNSTTVSKLGETADTLTFSVDASMNPSRTSVSLIVKYYTASSSNTTCSSSPSTYDYGTVAAASNELNGSGGRYGGDYSANIDSEDSIVCVNVRATLSSYGHDTILNGFYSIDVEGLVTTAVSDLTRTGRNVAFVVTPDSGRKISSVRYLSVIESHLLACLNEDLYVSVAKITNSREEIRTSQVRNYSASVSASSTHICIKVIHTGTTSPDYHGPYEIDIDEPPVVNPPVVNPLAVNVDISHIIVSDGRIKVTATADQEIENFRYIVKTGGAFNCRTLFGHGSSSSLSSIPVSTIVARGVMPRTASGQQRIAEKYLVAEHYGRYICVKATNEDEQMGFVGSVLPIEEEEVVTPDVPTISFTSDNRVYRASATGVVANSWQHVIKSSRACAERDFDRSPLRGSSYTVPESAGTDQNGKYACFRVRGTGTNGVYGYNSTVINVTVEEPDVPTISFTSDNRVYRASATGVVANSWQYVIKSSRACAERDFDRSPLRGSSYTVPESAGTDQNGKYACFRVRGTGTNGVYGYNSIVINVTVEEPDVPTISFTSDNRVYRASATGVVANSWQYVIKSSRACAERDFDRSPLRGSSYTVPESAGTDQNGKYACFRVRGTGTNGVYGYNSTVINVTVEEPDVPTISFTSDNRVYRASATGVVANSWQHVIKSSRACAERDFDRSPLRGSSYTVPESAGTDQNGKYACFRVRGTGTNGVYGYNSIVINVTVEEPDVPTISFTSDNRVYRASATGVVANSWQYVIKSSRACAERDFDRSPLRGSSYTVPESAGTDQNGKYACFRVRGTGTNGVYGYNSIVINVTVEEPDVPTISFTSDNRVYRASATGVVANSWQHVIKSSRACAERDFDRSPLSGSSYTVPESAGTDQNGKYACFRVRGTGTNGVYGYNSIVINVTIVEVDQTDDGIEDTTVVRVEEDSVAEAGKQDAADNEEIASTGDENERNWSQFAGYLLIAGAVLGIARVLIVKKYRQTG